MAYIILDNIPKSCEHCPVSYEAWDGATNCSLGNSNCPNWQYRPSDCKIKSIEGLIDKVEHCTDGMVANDSVMSGAMSIKNRIVEIIKEYCEVRK